MDESYVGRSMIDMYNTSSVGSSSFNTSTASGHGMPTLRPQISQDTLEKIDRMRTLLNMKLGPEHLAQRQGAGGSKLTYIEGWRVINLANEVFGFNGWSTEIKQLEVDFIDADQDTGKWNMGVTALVRVSLKDGCSREDIGYGKAENVKSKGDSLDKCKKEAVTDATKRALRTFGNLLGNCLYDKAYLADVSKMKSSKPKFDCNELHRATPMYPAASAAPTGHASTSAASILPPDVRNNSVTMPSTSTPQADHKPHLPPAARPVVPGKSTTAPPKAQAPQAPVQNAPSTIPARVHQPSLQSNAQRVMPSPRPETAQSAAYFSEMDESFLDGIELDAAQYAAESSPKEIQQAPSRAMSTAPQPAISRSTVPSAIVSAPPQRLSNAQHASAAYNNRPNPVPPQQTSRPPPQQQQPSRQAQHTARPNQPAQRPPFAIDQSRSAPVTNAQARQRAVPGGALPSVNVATNRNAPDTTNIEAVIAIGAKAAPELGHFAGGGFASARGVKRMAGEGDENQPTEGQILSPARKGNVMDEGNKRPRIAS